ncbi:MAG: TIGR00730 family Rossman fold protein [Fuerstiella sp.]
MARICVFCGSQTGKAPSFESVAKNVGESLVKHGHSLVYGGGSTGQMGLLADTMLQGNAEVIGIIPEALALPELMHSEVHDMRVVSDMHVRKAEMHSLAEAYLVLPGGLGTLEELFETVCWAQLDFHSAPIAVLNHNGLYDHLIHLLHEMKEQQFLTERHISLLNLLQTQQQCDQWLEQLSSKL